MFDNNFWMVLVLVIGALVFLFSHKLFPNPADDTIDDISENNIEIVDDFPDDIVNVPGHIFLYYSISTMDVYKVSITDDLEILDVFTNNGHMCKYIGGKIMEVVDDGKLLIVHPASLPS